MSNSQRAVSRNFRGAGRRLSSIALALTLASTAISAQANAASDKPIPPKTTDCGPGCGGKQVHPEHVRLTMELGAVSMALSDAALPRLTDPGLKAFAASEVEDQRENAKLFEAEKGAMAPAGFTALDRVRYAGPGPELDEVYRSEELAILRRQLASHERYRDSRKGKPRAPEGSEADMLMTVAVLSIGQVKEKIATVEATRKAAKTP